MDNFEKALKDRVENGERKQWVCHRCQKHNGNDDLVADANSIIWCPGCIRETLKPKTIMYSYKLPGRNEPCMCGSEKKYKHCCLKKKA